MACSYCARATPTSVAAAIADSSCGFGRRDIRLRVHAARYQRAHQSQARLVVGHRRVENAPLLVGHPQLKVVLRQRALRAEQGVRQLRRARLRRVAVLGHGIADAAPQIDLVGSLERQREDIVRTGHSAFAAMPVVGRRAPLDRRRATVDAPRDRRVAATPLPQASPAIRRRSISRGSRTARGSRSETTGPALPARVRARPGSSPLPR